MDDIPLRELAILLLLVLILYAVHFATTGFSWWIQPITYVAGFYLAWRFVRATERLADSPE